MMAAVSGIVLAYCIYLSPHLLSSACSLTVIGRNHGLWWETKHRLSDLQEAEDQGKSSASILDDGARSTVQPQIGNVLRIVSDVRLVLV